MIELNKSMFSMIECDMIKFDMISWKTKTLNTS